MAGTVTAPKFTVEDDDEKKSPKFTVEDESSPNQNPDLPGATPKLLQMVREGKATSAHSEPTRLERIGRMDPNERQANEFLLGAASGASGLPETLTPIHSAVDQVGQQTPKTLKDAAQQAFMSSMGPLPGLVSSLYHTGKEVLSPRGENESEDDAAERRAHGVGTAIGTAAPMMVGEGVAKAPDAAAVALRDSSNAIRPSIKLVSKAALPSGLFKELGPEVLDAIAPQRAVYPGASLPSADPFYENRGQDFMRRDSAQRTLDNREAVEARKAARPAPEPAASAGPALPTAQVVKLPVPREPLPTDDPGYMSSIPRGRLLDLARQGRPGAGQQLQNIGKTPLYVPEEYPGPRSVERLAPIGPSESSMRLPNVGVSTPEPRPQYTYKPSEKAATMSADRPSLGPEFEQGEDAHEIERYKAIVRNPRATPEEKRIAQSRIDETGRLQRIK